MNVLLFGTGKFYQRYKHLFQEVQVVGLVDNHNPAKEVDGFPVLRPEMLERVSFDRIYLLLSNDAPVLQQLLALGIPHEKIYQVRDLPLWDDGNRPAFPIRQEEGQHPAKGRALLISNGYSRTGAPLVLYYAACILKAHGYDVAVISPDDGVLRAAYAAHGIATVVDQELRRGRLDRLPWETCDFVLVNTFTFADLLRHRQCSIPVFFWIHEADKYYEGLDDILDAGDWTGVRVACVSRWAERNFRSRVKYSGAVEIFPYGIPDAADGFARRPEKRSRPIVFAIVGTLSDIKGQAFFLGVWKQLETLQVGAELWIIGNGEEGNVEVRRIHEAAEGCENVQFLGELPHDVLLKKYEEINILVCPSTDDPLPVVVTEAMMFGKPCLVSDHTGTASFIKHGVNGWVFRSGDAEELAQKLQEIIAAQAAWPQIGERARECYERHFSFEAFETRVLDEAARLMQLSRKVADE